MLSPTKYVIEEKRLYDALDRARKAGNGAEVQRLLAELTRLKASKHQRL